MNYKLMLNTVMHLKMTQVFHQVKYRLMKPTYKEMVAPDCKRGCMKTEPIPRFTSLNGNCFEFLNLEHEFAGWNYTDNGMLWAYNQNYFDFINQESINKECACKWIDIFIDEISSNKVGLDPGPISIRSINWIKFFCKHPDCATKKRLNCLWSQVMLLERKLEYHILGNHLLENAFSLYANATFFQDASLMRKARRILLSQLVEQTLPDGAHFEQSPMYHCIMLDRLLDCINITSTTDASDFTDKIRQYAEKMLGHLESIVWNDGSIPMLNDSANGIAPKAERIFDYARRLGLKWEAIPMKECGYRKMTSEHIEAIVDVGNITASYQPGHTHADSLNYELRIDGKPFVVDTGISTYNKNERRQIERSTIAHNCVSPDGINSSEVWSGFRVGKRCHVEITDLTDNTIIAWHNGYKKMCKRRFEMTEKGFVVEDWYEGEATSYVHLTEWADPQRIKVEGTSNIEIKPWKYSTEYNKFHKGNVLEIKFKNHLKYVIQ